MKRSLFLVAAVVVLVACVTPASFKSLVYSTPAFKGAVDARGLIRVEYRSDPSGEDPAADANGVIKYAKHLCGSALNAELVKLQKDLKFRYDLAAQQGQPDPVTCVYDVCSHSTIGEFDVTGDYAFTNDKLRSVVRIEGATISESFRAAGHAYATQAMDSLGSLTCP